MANKTHTEELQFGRRFTILAVAFVVTVLGSFTLGRYAVSLPDLFGILADQLLRTLGHLLGQPMGLTPVWTQAAETVLLHVRMPRIIAAVAIGAALSTAGASYQGMFRNPMVSPDILGASTGAGFGAAIGIFLGFNYIGITIISFLFGLGAVFLAYCIGRASRLNAILSMVLSGMMVSSLFSASTSFIKLIADTDNKLPAITYWLMGSLSSITDSDALFVSVLVLVGLTPLILLRWRINLLTVSEDEAKSLGVNTTMLRLVVIMAATLMTAAAVSVSGMIGWVGLIIPHFCRLIFGYDYRRLIPASILLGGTFMVVVDNIARTVTTGEMPLGILTAFVGAPVFVWLILRGGALHDR